MYEGFEPCSTEWDRKHNPYLHMYVQEIVPMNWSDRFSRRFEWVKEYSWAIPTHYAVETIAAFAGDRPIIEVGCGTGYWLSLLAKCGAVAYGFDDMDEENHYGHQVGQWSNNVIHGNHEYALNVANELAAAAVDPVLMLCWPPYLDNYAAQLAKKWPGNSMVYIGEGWGGCTADNEFHETVNGDGIWDEGHRIELPQWEGIHDAVYLFEKNKE